MQKKTQVIDRPLTPSEQDFYNTMAGHYEKRAQVMPGIQLLADKALSMRETANRGSVRVVDVPSPDDLDVLL